MSHTNCITDKVLKSKAKELFFAKGNLTASTQEIADFAGVKRTLVNYYFGSKNELFKIAYQELIDEMKSNLNAIYLKAVPFKDKVTDIIDYLILFRGDYPFLEVFNIQETVKMQNDLDTIVQPKFSDATRQFILEIKQEMEKGTIKEQHPVGFIMNIFALISLPILMRPIYLNVFDLDDQQYQDILTQRKEIALKLLFN